MPIQHVSLGGLTFNQYLSQSGGFPALPASSTRWAPSGALLTLDQIGLSAVAASPPPPPAPTFLDRVQGWLSQAVSFGRSALHIPSGMPTAAGRVRVQAVGGGFHLMGSLPGSARSDRGQDRQARATFDAMAAAAARDGVNLRINSNYRSAAQQQVLWERSDRSGHWVAAPGHSEHQTGLAFDIGTRGYSGGSRGNFDQSPAYRWLKENGYRFGFVQSMSWEAWHWRFDPEAVRVALAGRTTGTRLV